MIRAILALALVATAACAPTASPPIDDGGNAGPLITGPGQTFFEPVPGDPLCQREIFADTGEVISVICA